MAVAWVGDREASLEQAVESAAGFLQASRCPVFTFDADVHATRAVIALAERTGAAYDQAEGGALAGETALFTDRGGMTMAFGEVRRRADVVVIVGAIPEAYDTLLAELVETFPDHSGNARRTIFSIGDAAAQPRAVALACGSFGVAATLGAIRAVLSDRQVSTPVSNADALVATLAKARFPVFIFSGQGLDPLAMEMLQGLVSDLNSKGRASSLHLPASENGWGSVLVSTWMTGFAPRTSFASGFPRYDPWRYDAARMLASGEADFHLWLSTGPHRSPPSAGTATLVALTRTTTPVANAAVTIAVGQAGTDHDGVVYSARSGTLQFLAGPGDTRRPSAATVLRAMAGHLPAGTGLPC